MGMETSGELVDLAKAEERIRIGRLLARRSYVAGDGIRMHTTHLDAMLRLIGLSDDEVARLLKSVKTT